MVRKVDEPWMKCRNPTDLDWTRAFAHDGRDPRSWPHTKPWSRTACTGTELHCKPNGAWISCSRCAFRLHYIPRHTARKTSVSTPSSASVQEALKRMSLLRDNDFAAGAVSNTVYNSGAASSATISSGTPVRREISTPPSPQSSPITRLWRRFIVGILQKEKMRVRRENAQMMDEDLWKRCRDAWHGNFSEAHRWLMLVSQRIFKRCWMRRPVDRCDFVEICCSDVLRLTEAMQRRGRSSFSLLRSDGVGNHDAQTRENIVSWLTEKRPQKAWLSPRVVTHQNNSTRCSLRARQIFRQFFVYAAAVLRGGGHIYWEWPAKCIGWSSVELREFRAQQKSCGRKLFMTACDCCFSAKKENNLLERRRWQFLTSDPRFKEFMSLQCQGNHEHVWKQT